MEEDEKKHIKSGFCMVYNFIVAFYYFSKIELSKILKQKRQTDSHEPICHQIII